MRSASIALACLLAAACSAPPAPEASSAEPLNIVVILADDLGYNDVGVYDSQFIKTPHIDQLARNGVRLTDAYVSAAVCSPSRAGLYTGRYQPRFGYEYNPTYHDAELGLPTNETTLANQHPAIVERLEAELKAWNSQLADPIWLSQRSTLHELHERMIQLFF